MGRIKIVKTTILPQKHADYVLHTKKVLHGEDLKKVLDTNKTELKFVSMEKPEMCPKCLTPGKVVNYNGSEGHFRCVVCQYKWG